MPGALAALVLGLAAAGSSDAGVRLTGVVRELGTRDPIPLATLRAGDQQVEASVDGRFELALPAGTSNVEVSASGYRPRTFTETAEAGTAVDVIYRLEPTDLGYRSVVTAQRARTEASRVALTPRELTDTAGTSGEPLRAVMQLPGVSAIASGLAYPIVRGTQPAATGYFIDGVRVPQLFHAVVGLSVLHPDFIERLDFYPGLPPVQLGRLLGGAVDLTAARPHDDRVHLNASIDLINLSAFADVPLSKTGTSITAAARLSYTPLIGARFAGALLPATGGAPPSTPVANFWDYQLRVEQSLGRASVRAFVFGSSDQTGTVSDAPNVPSGLLDTGFHRADLRLVVPLSGGSAEVGLTAGVDRASLSGAQGPTPLFGIHMDRSMLAGRAAVQTQWRGISIRAGLDAELQQTTASAMGATPNRPDVSVSLLPPVASGFFGGAYVSAHHEAGPLETTLGLRADLYHLAAPASVTFPAVAPRLEERLRLGDGFAVRAGAGLFHQPPTVLVSLPVTDLAGLAQGLQWAAHFEVGADARLPLNAELGITGFVQPLFRAVEYRLDALVDPRSELGTSGAVTSGRAYGLELFVRRVQQGRWYGWLSATLQRSERSRTIVRFDNAGSVVGVPFTATVPFAFDETFVLNGTVGVLLPYGFSAGATLHFNTGRPESGDVSSRAMRAATDPTTGALWWVPQQLDRVDRLPPYARLDVRVAKTFRLQDLMLELYLDVFNAALSREVLGYTYGVVNPGPSAQLTKVPFSVPLILPMLGLKGRY